MLDATPYLNSTDSHDPTLVYLSSCTPFTGIAPQLSPLLRQSALPHLAPLRQLQNSPYSRRFSIPICMYPLIPYFFPTSAFNSMISDRGALLLRNSVDFSPFYVTYALVFCMGTHEFHTHSLISRRPSFREEKKGLIEFFGFLNRNV